MTEDDRSRFDTGKLRKIVDDQRQEMHERVDEQVPIRTRTVRKGDLLKFAGLVAFFVVMAVACVVLWPSFKGLFSAGGTDQVVNDVQQAGVAGFLMLLGLQFLQIVVAVIPGEVVQVAAGMLYGPWLGALLILLGCLVASAFVFQLVHKLGAPFVRDMVSTRYLDRFHDFERTGKLDAVVFVLFLIPGLPKDVFTYLVPLTGMSMGRFLLLSTVGRIPGVLVSTYAADGLVDGRIAQSVAIFVAAALVVLVGVLCRERIMGFLERHLPRRRR